MFNCSKNISPGLAVSSLLGADPRFQGDVAGGRVERRKLKRPVTPRTLKSRGLHQASLVGAGPGPLAWLSPGHGKVTGTGRVPPALEESAGVPALSLP